MGKIKFKEEARIKIISEKTMLPPKNSKTLSLLTKTNKKALPKVKSKRIKRVAPEKKK